MLEGCEHMSASLDRVVEEIVALSPHDKERLLERLRMLLKMEPDEWARLKLAEAAFAFWNNDSDADYDHL
jgi:alpha-ketoglutarate-dependent taurine dioxygenase